MRTKAGFKALRETVGMSQQLLAHLLNVDIRSVRRWESASESAYKGAPDDAWELLEGFRNRQDWAVDTALAKVPEIEDELSDMELREVSLTYWANADQYEAAHPGEGDFWQMANADSRLIATLLRAEGYTVNFDFPGLRAVGLSD